MPDRLGIGCPEPRGRTRRDYLTPGSIEPEIRGRLFVVEHHPFLLIPTGVFNLVVRGVLVAFRRRVGVVRFFDVRLGIESTLPPRSSTEVAPSAAAAVSVRSGSGSSRCDGGAAAVVASVIAPTAVTASVTRPPRAAASSADANASPRCIPTCRVLVHRARKDHPHAGAESEQMFAGQRTYLVAGTGRAAAGQQLVCNRRKREHVGRRTRASARDSLRRAYGRRTGARSPIRSSDSTTPKPLARASSGVTKISRRWSEPWPIPAVRAKSIAPASWVRNGSA